MRRGVLVRLLILWVTFGLGAALGAWVMSRHAGVCETRIVDLDVDALTSAAQAALPAAITGSGVVQFAIDPTGIRVHSESSFTSQSYDTRVLAVVRGSPMTLDVSTKLLQRMLNR